MPRLPREELIREITRELETDRDISTREISRRLRGRGVRVGNERLRAVARALRRQATDLASALSIPREEIPTERQYQQILREFADTSIQGQRLIEEPTHTRLSWVARARIAVYHYGDLLSVEDVTARGIAVYSLADYRPELLAARAAHDLVIQAVRQAGDFPDTLIEGIETEVLYQDIQIQDADLRGSQNRYGARRQ